MGTSQPGITIEEVYLKYQKSIFAKLIWPHLFDENVKYEDKDIFEKTEIYLKALFVKIGFEWNEDNREKIHMLVLDSDNAKLITDYFQGNYEKCIENPLDWVSDSSVQRMVNQLIDASIQKNLKLSYEYAKRLLVKYYYEKFMAANDKEKVITNVITMFFTVNDIQRLSVETEHHLDSIIGTAYRRLNEFLGVKINAKFFIRKFVLLRSFHMCLQNNVHLMEQLVDSQYALVYQDLLDLINDSLKKLPVKEIQRKPIAKNATDEEKNRNDEKLTKEVKQETSSIEQTENEEQLKTSTKEKSLSSGASARETPIDIFLKRIGGKNSCKEDIVSMLLSDAEEIIEKIDMHNMVYESYDMVLINDDLVDVEIEELKY